MLRQTAKALHTDAKPAAFAAMRAAPGASNDAAASAHQNSPRQLAQGAQIAQLQQPPAPSHSEPQRADQLPLPLRSGIASLSGIDLADVRVHRNSTQPAQLQAHAFAQGADIHLAPGQDRHLPHEAWHLVQQRQGRVNASAQLAGRAINDDPQLEREADQMGQRALQASGAAAVELQQGETSPAASTVAQCLSDADAVPANLQTALTGYHADSDLHVFHRRPESLRNADGLLTPLAGKATLTRRQQLSLLDGTRLVEQWLATVAASVLTGKELTRRTAMQTLVQEVHAFLGTGANLAAAVQAQGGQIEHNAVVPDFVAWLRKNGFTETPPSGVERLNAEGARRYDELKRNFEFRNQHRIKLSPDGAPAGSDSDNVQKLIDNTYPRYQTALRAPDNASATKHHLIESSLISDSLATATPEAVTRERYAQTFPGGEADPAALVVGQTYTEQGFIFVGGERPSNAGKHMMITLTKGYPVDARRYYGHRTDDNDKKMQWLTMPGAQFRYDRVEGAGDKAIYHFTQISR
ncbi:DUF4157 domain-containing protein [Paucibacter sp. APW11]|uniref:DUF4157 domain-containing protein n=1 Tax=Roseateles aquae TaxID=3077235 RepID=A0ABU3PHD5_9BURK|nr:DUF4157 domain-containing protein [Paucibacter sp. APW11]MDT9001498.1 DUF4157 domain-containing protein [Paucibacter sp. APW11]